MGGEHLQDQALPGEGEEARRPVGEADEALGPEDVGGQDSRNPQKSWKRKGLSLR
ncbi:hypothetical protein TthSNM11_24630 (plasmid) [Thermus thermophilus]|nr:hypothetical protein TthSNM11_24630 [Thermus thermophilus]